MELKISNTKHYSLVSNENTSRPSNYFSKPCRKTIQRYLANYAKSILRNNQFCSDLVKYHKQINIKYLVWKIPTVCMRNNKSSATYGTTRQADDWFDGRQLHPDRILQYIKNHLFVEWVGGRRGVIPHHNLPTVCNINLNTTR